MGGAVMEQKRPQGGEPPGKGAGGRLTGIFFWGFVALGLLALPAWSFWAGKGGTVVSSGAVLWCAWSGEGGVPALALTNCPGAGSPLEALVLLPGEGRAGTCLREGLRQAGVAALGECFLPSSAAFARSAEQLCREMTVRRLSLAVPLRGKNAGDALAGSLGAGGTALGRIVPVKSGEGESLWEDSWSGGVLRVWRKGVEWRGEWLPARAETPFVSFCHGVTGETVVRSATGRVLLTLPQRSPGGFLRIPIGPDEVPPDTLGGPG